MILPPKYVQFVAIAVMLVPSMALADANDWPNWRGPDQTGSKAEGEYPSVLDATTLVWKTPLPGRGCSMPIVLDKHIYVTMPVDGEDALVALDWTGKILWQRKLGGEDAGKHRNGSGSNASPTTDGSAIFCFFKSGTLAAIELDGTIRWQTNMVERFGPDTLFWDHGTSPVLTSEHVVMTRMHKGESWLAAFDKVSGKLAWKVARNYEVKIENDHGYATPLVISRDGEEALLLWGAERITIHSAKDGNMIWSCGGFNPDQNKLWPAIATPSIIGDTAIVAYGRNDKGSPLLYGVDLRGKGDGSPSFKWKRTDVSTFVPTPVAYQDSFYMVGDQGKVNRLNPSTGESIWSGEFAKSRKKFYASPLVAGGKIYAPREDGTVFVAQEKAGKLETLSENELGESVIGSPVPSANRILIRGEEHLFCYSDGAQANETR